MAHPLSTHIEILRRSGTHGLARRAAYITGITIADAATGRTIASSDRAGVREWGFEGWDRTIFEFCVEAREAERSNTRGDQAVLGREFNFDLPHWLPLHLQRVLALLVAILWSARFGVAVLWAIHEAPFGGDCWNVHCHMIISSRVVQGRAFGAKAREQDTRGVCSAFIRETRKYIADFANELAPHFDAEKWEHRSFQAQGKNWEPTKHCGPVRTAALRKTGIPTALHLTNASLLAQRPVENSSDGKPQPDGASVRGPEIGSQQKLGAMDEVEPEYFEATYKSLEDLPPPEPRKKSVVTSPTLPAEGQGDLASGKIPQSSRHETATDRNNVPDLEQSSQLRSDDVEGVESKGFEAKDRSLDEPPPPGPCETSLPGSSRALWEVDLISDRIPERSHSDIPPPCSSKDLPDRDQPGAEPPVAAATSESEDVTTAESDGPDSEHNDLPFLHPEGHRDLSLLKPPPPVRHDGHEPT